VKVCNKTCIFCFFPIINKYLCMAKRSLLSERPTYIIIMYFYTNVDVHSLRVAIEELKHVGVLVP